ncbi:uncharacterized protein BX663DRAFT_494979 [Cokeromyces recurvatus]|uniref:uncharacterized protein n=1 Tax=Cokeromyces recurvatus TaxID=90255 RepID=UPI0022211C74|nr:uncharacterized protein BX663DRAFT_494979 [Cokeromyces recurvatus]KAI7907145.1 hypothetical protein BX663DRAFT_494979 [Cokeromyces recurvatus]
MNKSSLRAYWTFLYKFNFHLHKLNHIKDFNSYYLAERSKRNTKIQKKRTLKSM